MRLVLLVQRDHLVQQEPGQLGLQGLPDQVARAGLPVREHQVPLALQVLQVRLEQERLVLRDPQGQADRLAQPGRESLGQVDHRDLRVLLVQELRVPVVLVDLLALADQPVQDQLDPVAQVARLGQQELEALDRLDRVGQQALAAQDPVVRQGQQE